MRIEKPSILGKTDAHFKILEGLTQYRYVSLPVRLNWGLFVYRKEF